MVSTIYSSIVRHYTVIDMCMNLGEYQLVFICDHDYKCVDASMGIISL